MERLSDFKPLERLSLPVLGDLDCRGLVLIVGPNSSGKTQLLQDIYLRVSGEPRELIVAEEVLIRKPDFAPFLDVLKREGYVETILDDDGTPHIRPLTTYLGSNQGASQIRANDAQGWHGAYSRSDTSSGNGKSAFLSYFGRFLVTGLFLDRRLNLVKQVGSLDYQTQSPQHDLHVLYVNDDAKRALTEETLKTFGRALWPDSSRGSILCLRVSDGRAVPSAEERLSPKTMSQFRTIESEGDGMKSYVATCIALLLGSRPVCIVDEPEMCLHPPQAYNLGRFIGKFASYEHATFVATHSSHVLRGRKLSSRMRRSVINN